MYKIISHYRIIKKLGAGGMGEVYLSQDTILDRKVALKILPADVVANKERMRRFVQEAKAAAALNHPNIAHIYEIGEAEGVNYIAMEFIDGQTLREYIHRGQTDLGKLLRHMQHVAGGLAKAHDAGIVHRDLKPDNIMITRDDHAKILDFGLAKLIEPQQPTAINENASELATAILQQHSTPGRILGTAGYMSPEQAQGKTNEIDHRTDIFSFGCILFEALTGHKAFEGKDAIDTLNKTIRERVPPIADFRPDAPYDLQKIVRRCLAKDPEDRYQTIKDVAIELRELRRDLAGSAELDTTVPPRPAVGSLAITASSSTTQSSSSSAEYLINEIKRHKTGVAVALGATLLAVIALGVGLYRFAGRNQIAFSNLKIARLTTSGNVQNAAISPDGKYIVYAVKEGALQSLWLGQVAVTSRQQILAPAEVEYVGETFSPDGNFIYYVAKDANNSAGTLYQAPVLGGSPRKILTEVTSPVTFSPDARRIAFVRFEEQTMGDYILMIANVDGTNERRLAVRKGHEWFARFGPGWSPDGKEIAVGAGSEIGEWRQFVIVVDVESGAQKEFSSQKFSYYGRVCWLADGSGMVMIGADQESYLCQIWLISYPGGEARQITHDFSDYSQVSLTAGSKFVATVPYDTTDTIWVGPFDNPGQAKQITSGKLEGTLGLAWTPDRTIVYTSHASGNTDLWIMNADGTHQKQLTDDPHLDYIPTISPDGRYIVFLSTRAGSVSLWRMNIDGGNLKQLTSGQDDTMPQISPDGRWVIFNSWRSGRKTLWKVPIDGGEPVQLADKFTFCCGISPDGKLIACYYQEQPNSPVKVLVMPFEGGEPVRVFDLPTGPELFGDILSPIVWTPDRRAVMYLDMRGGTRNVWSQPLDGAKPVQLTNFTSNDIRWSVLSSDGKQIAFTRETISSDVVLLSDFR